MTKQEQFAQGATPCLFRLGDRVIAILPRVFTSGSCGWFGNGPVVLDEVPCQYTISIVAKGSKEWVGEASPRQPGRFCSMPEVPQEPSAPLFEERPSAYLPDEPESTPEALPAKPAKKAQRRPKDQV